MTRKLIKLWVICLFSGFGFFSTATVYAAGLTNAEALKGLKDVYALYDVRNSNPKVVLANLKFIESNYQNLLKEKVKPHLRIIFISGAVQFITTQPSEMVDMEYGDTLQAIAVQVERLVKLGVAMEACGGAMAYFNVDYNTLLPGIKPVRSGFISVMGWQAQGYSLIPVY